MKSIENARAYDVVQMLWRLILARVPEFGAQRPGFQPLFRFFAAAHGARIPPMVLLSGCTLSFSARRSMLISAPVPKSRLREIFRACRERPSRRFENIHSATQMFAKTASGILPILDSIRSGRVAGTVGEAHALRRYSQELSPEAVCIGPLPTLRR